MKNPHRDIVEAASTGDLGAVQMFLHDASLSRDMVWNAFEAALAGHHHPIIETLRIRQEFSDFTIHDAAREGLVAILEWLVSKGISPNEVDRAEHYSLKGDVYEVWLRAPLHDAVIGRKLNAVEFLVAVGANVEAKDADKRTPLMIAAEHGNLELFNALLAAGAKPLTIGLANRDALILAAENGHLDLVKRILEILPEAEIQGAVGRALVIVSRNRDLRLKEHCEVLSCLLAKQPDQKSKDEALDNSFGGLDFARWLPVTRFLIAAGANVHVLENRGPLTIAVLLGQVDQTRNLAATADGSDIDFALGIAVAQGFLEIVRVLLAAGASLDDSLSIAAESGHPEIVKLLLPEASMEELDWAVTVAFDRGNSGVIQVLRDELRASFPDILDRAESLDLTAIADLLSTEETPESNTP